ncbi:MAG: hypothetical protein KC646_08550 [Candidatus Cloacimonetes bacterium]|nr:hypothetical protein [Candidatus Cloacimonadota bacterium]
MQNLKLYFFYFKESFRLISPIQEAISNLALIQILRSALHFFIIPFVILYSLFALTHYQNMGEIYWTYFSISALFLFFLSSFLSKRFGLMLLVAYYNFYEVGKKLGLKELFRSSKEYTLAKKSFIHEMATVPAKYQEFFGTMRFYDVVFARKATTMEQIPQEVIDHYDSILSLEKSNKSIHFTISWLLVFVVTLIHLLPLTPVSGLYALNTQALTITNTIGICIFTSLIIGIVEYFHNGFIKHNKLKYILYANCQNYDACGNVYSRVQEHYRETKVAISYKLFEDYKIDFIFLGCMYIFTFLLSWIFSSIAYACGTVIVLLYPIILRKLSRSRMFMGLRLVKEKGTASFGLSHALLYIHYFLNLLLLMIASKLFIFSLPSINLLFLSKLLELFRFQPWLQDFVAFDPIVFIVYFFMSLALLGQLKRTGHATKSKLFEIAAVYLFNSIFIYLVSMSYVGGIHYSLIGLVFVQYSLLKVIQRGLNK